MSRFHSYLSSAVKAVESFDGEQPLVYHLKHFFAADKKYGSRDRKLIASLCYYYFRCGFALKNVSTEKRIIAGIFLCEQNSNEMLQDLDPGLNHQITLSYIFKLALLKINAGDIFPFTNELNSGIDTELFCISFLQQPHLFLRIRPGKKKSTIDKLDKLPITYHLLSDDCIMLANSTKVDDILNVNKDVVVQDYNSQKVFDYLKQSSPVFENEIKITAWDCCAASGGKSILLYDILKGRLRLTVSDIRDNILFNLKKRFQQAKVNMDKCFVTDLAIEQPGAFKDNFSIIVCDAPCTGSGTWSRTPEQLCFFDAGKIDEYAERQKKIVSNAVIHLKENGLFFYITCSVFKKENEAIALYIKEKFQLQLLQMEFLKGYEHHADSMFVAVFSK